MIHEERQFHTGEVSRIERRWVWVFGLVVMIATTIPYLIGYNSQGADWEFTGFVFGVEDGNPYIAKMLTGADGAWLFRTSYTTYPQSGVFAYIPYILIGKFSAKPAQHEQLVAIYHLMRVVCGFLAIYATYDFIALFLSNVWLRKTGLAISILGGGSGWFVILAGREHWLGSLPLEFYSPESFGFLSLYGIPHLNLARAALLWGVTAYLRSVNRIEIFNLKQVAKVGCNWLLVALAQPLTAVVMTIVFSLHLLSLCLTQIWLRLKTNLLDWKKITFIVRFLFLAGLIPAPFLIYNIIVFNRDPFLISWMEQSVVTSPQPIHYIVAYGLVIPFAFKGGKRLLNYSPDLGLLPFVWFIALPLLAYFPYYQQRRMTEGIWVAMVILMLFNIQFNKPVNRRSKIIVLLFIGMTSISSCMLILGGIMTAVNPSHPTFRLKNEVKAFIYLSEYAKTNDIVLASYSTSNALPAWAPVKVLVGHGPLSIGGSELTPKVNKIFRIDTTDKERVIFLEDQGIDFVLWGPDERKQGGWNPNEAKFLKKVYQNDNVSLFSVELTND